MGTTEVKAYCGNCGNEVKVDDVNCSKCMRSLNEVGKLIKVDISSSIGISGTLSYQLTKQEQKTLDKIQKWLVKNIKSFELSEFEIGFPSGVKVKFSRTKEKD